MSQRVRPKLDPYAKTFAENAEPFDPYKQVEDDSKDRMNADVAFTDADIIRIIYPRRGIFQQMINMFFRAVVEECVAKGINHYDPTGGTERDFIDIIRRRTAPWSPANGPVQGSVTGSADQLRSDNPDGANVVPDPALKVGRGRRGGRGGGAKTKEGKVG